MQERIRSLQADLNATYNRLLGVGETAPGTPLPNLHGRAVELEREISELRLRSVPTTSDPFTTTTPSEAWEDFPADVTLLAYHITGDEIIAFVGEGTGCGSCETALRWGPCRGYCGSWTCNGIAWERATGSWTSTRST